MIESWVPTIVERMRQQPDSVTIVGVDGHSAAGKSTFATALAEAVGGALVSGDDFYRVMDESQRSQLTPAQGVDLYYDWQRLRDEVLIPLKAGRSARFHPYDWDANDLSSTVRTIGARKTVVVEGLFVSRPELDQLVDLTVLVTADAATRRRRQQERADASNEWLGRWDEAEQWYFQNIRPPASFDLTTTGLS